MSTQRERELHDDLEDAERSRRNWHILCALGYPAIAALVWLAIWVGFQVEWDENLVTGSQVGAIVQFVVTAAIAVGGGMGLALYTGDSHDAVREAQRAYRDYGLRDKS